MFDPEEYFARVEEAIDLCSEYSTRTGQRPQIELSPTTKAWRLIVWKETIEFFTGHKLHIFEGHKREGRDHMRRVKYHLMNDANECVFRVDNHDRPVPFSTPCHIHEGEMKFEDGDPHLQGMSLREIGFLEVMEWVLKIVEGKPLPWRE
jgi:hypothetical protein